MDKKLAAIEFGLNQLVDRLEIMSVLIREDKLTGLIWVVLDDSRRALKEIKEQEDALFRIYYEQRKA
jgi:hypothetical protein